MVVFFTNVKGEHWFFLSKIHLASLSIEEKKKPMRLLPPNMKDEMGYISPGTYGVDVWSSLTIAVST